MALFEQACALDEAARADFLAHECHGDDALRAQVQAMLEHDRRASGGMSEPGAGMHMLARASAADDGNAEVDLHPTHSPLPGPAVTGRGVLQHVPLPVPMLAGQYRIIRVIGEGGMGIVYLAQQARPRRLVALKALRPGTASRHMLRRFEHEAQILGRLQHPGIAQIYEAGAAAAESADQAYFAMEYVSGLPLTEHADERRLDHRQRVELMLRVCDAVEHAHQRGVIHRDLKPSNILVAEEPTEDLQTSGPSQPKILDFGVARTLDVDPALTTMHTHAGQLVGTLSYMSPEQVAGDSSRIDTRSDVYGLGVILYQLLGKRLPLEFTGLPLTEAARLIRDVEPPRLGTIDRALRGDLEVIVAKAMEKDANRRYQSVAALRSDLRCALDGLPIDAKRDSAVYVLRKHLIRHRTAVTAGVLALLGLLAFAVYAFIAAQRNAELADRERAAHEGADAALHVAEQQRDRADHSAADYKRELAVNAIERGRLLGQTGNLAAAEDLLWDAEAKQPGTRHVHWALWELYSRLPCIATLDCGLKSLRSMAVAPDLSSVALGSDNGVTQFWTLNPWKQVAAFDSGGNVVAPLAYSADGTLIASPINGKDIALWNAASHERQAILTGHELAVRSLAFSPDNRLLASGGDDSTVRIWDVARGACIAVLQAQDARGQSLALAPPLVVPPMVFAPDSRALAWGCFDRSIRVWRDVNDAAAQSLSLTGSNEMPAVVTFANDSATLYSGSSDRDIREWSIEGAGSCKRTFVAPNGTIRALQVSRDGKSLLAAGWWTLDVWDLPSGTRRRSIAMPVGGVFARWSADETHVVTGHPTGMLRIWDMTPMESAVYGDHVGRCTAFFSHDGSLIASGDGAGNLIVRRREDGSILWHKVAHRGRIYSVRFSPDGTLLASVANDGYVRLWDARSGALLHQLAGAEGVSQDSLAFSPEGTLLAVSWNDFTFRLFDVPTLQPRLTFGKTAGESLAVRFSPDGKSMVSVSRNYAVALWNLDGTPIRTLPVEASAWTCAFAPDAHALVAGTWGKTLMIWDAASGRRVAVLEGHNGLPSGVAFDPTDNAVAATAAADGCVRLWDVDDPRNLLTINAFDNAEAITVDISSDGRWLLSAGADGTVKVWDLRRFDRSIEGNREQQMRLHKPAE
jgi:WD40 repeat protein/serine/threonine protein kinase